MLFQERKLDKPLSFGMSLNLTTDIGLYELSVAESAEGFVSGEGDEVLDEDMVSKGLKVD